MNRTICLNKHETVINKDYLAELQKEEKSIPIYKYEDTVGWYAYDEVHNRHFLIYGALHGLTEKRIYDLKLLAKSSDNERSWTFPFKD